MAPAWQDSTQQRGSKAADIVVTMLYVDVCLASMQDFGREQAETQADQPEKCVVCQLVVQQALPTI